MRDSHRAYVIRFSPGLPCWVLIIRFSLGLPLPGTHIPSEGTKKPKTSNVFTILSSKLVTPLLCKSFFCLCKFLLFKIFYYSCIIYRHTLPLSSTLWMWLFTSFGLSQPLVIRARPRNPIGNSPLLVMDDFANAPCIPHDSVKH